MTDNPDDWYGLHEQLDTPALRQRLDALGLSELASWSSKLAMDDVPPALNAHLSRALAELLLSLRERDRAAWKEVMMTFARALQATNHPLLDLVEALPVQPYRQLLEVKHPDAGLLHEKPTSRPDIPLGLSALLTGSRHSPSLIGQLEKELASANRADWLVSFIKFSGVKALKQSLLRFTEQETPNGTPKLRIATTSYLGATDLKAIEVLLELPNTEVRVSYDTHRTRLHAKAYLFHRRTGFGTAYVGSANVSRVALDEGLEWTARVSQHELPHLWRQLIAGFETHWLDPVEFERVTAADLGRLEESLAQEGGQNARGAVRRAHFFELQPYGFQQEILDAIQAERDVGLKRHLVIAATGTGKTMIAAFDYRRLAQASSCGRRPSLLFIAHREEILRQALDTFRHVLRDEDFGDLLLDGSHPAQRQYLFCSVQSWNARNLYELSPGHFDYVVLDEAHHATASSYQRILRHIAPVSLLGLTATPERNDGGDIRNDFGGGFTHEMRLTDAVEARHLAPFHYFGITDAPDVDFSRLRWQRGGYRTEDLDRVIGSNERRASWVLENLVDHVADISRVRGLGFCVSKAHARFMANFFCTRGVPSEALTSDSPDAQRKDVQRRLVAHEIRIVFTVDLYNEGVDIPEVDTVMFLRPTESLTVYLQQLGRGLRLHDTKPHLTVLDFIAPQHRKFRFADRFRALSANVDQRLDRQIEQGFPWLPAGCLVRLDQKATAVVLDNIRDTLAPRRPQVITQLRALLAVDPSPGIQQMLDWLHLDNPDDLLRHGLPCDLLEQSGAAERPRPRQFDRDIARGLRQLLWMDDLEVLSALSNGIEGRSPASESERLRLVLGLTLLSGPEQRAVGAVGYLEQLRNSSALVENLLEVIALRRSQLLQSRPVQFDDFSGVLSLHRSYIREQILFALGRGTFQLPFSHREGAIHVPERKIDAFFVTIHKNEGDFSPSTQYEDYALTNRLFHWQSRSTITPGSPTGQRYIEHAARGYQPLLFVREKRKLDNGLTSPFRYLGPIFYQNHQGSRPVSIVWRLQHELPARYLRNYRLDAV